MNEYANEIGQTESSKIYELDPRAGMGEYGVQAYSSVRHFKETGQDHEVWQDVDIKYYEESEVKDVGRVKIYPKLHHLLVVYQDICGYELTNRSDPRSKVRVRLAEVDGQPCEKWLDDKDTRLSMSISSCHVGLWKECFNHVERRFKWLIEETGKPFVDLIKNPTCEVDTTDEFAKVRNDVVVPVKTAISDLSTTKFDSAFYWDEVVPANVLKVDTDYYSTSKEVCVSNYGSYWGGLGLAGIFQGIGYGSPYLYRAVFHLTGLTIPNSAIILTATMNFKCAQSMGSAGSFTMTFDAADNVEWPSASWENFWGLTTSTLTGASYAPSSLTSGTRYTTSSLVTPFQALVNRAGWLSTNKAAFVWGGCNSSGSWTRAYGSYDADDPYWSVTYSPSGRVNRVMTPAYFFLNSNLLGRQ